LWDLTLLSTVLALLYFIVIFLYRNKFGANSKKIALKKEQFAPMVSKFLFYDGLDSSKAEHHEYILLKVQIRTLLKDKKNREVLSEVLLELQKDLAGDALKGLYTLYQDLELYEDAYVRLKSWRWEVVSKGILELTRMQVGIAYNFITPFINHRKSVVRKQAEIAVVSLKNEGISYFLDTAKYRISEWQQLKLLDVIRNLEGFIPPRFKQWLVSSNPDVVLFALRLIKYYDQNDAIISIIPLVKHKNDTIKLAALECIQRFGYSQALTVIKPIFFKCNTDVKLLVLDTIANLGDETDIPFLQKVAASDKNFNITSKAIGVINTINPNTVLPEKGLDSSLTQIAEEPSMTVLDTEKELDTSATIKIPVPRENQFEAEHHTEIENISSTSQDTDEVDNIEEELPSLSNNQANLLDFILHANEIDLTPENAEAIEETALEEILEDQNESVSVHEFDLELSEDEVMEATLLQNLHYIPRGSVFRRLYFEKTDAQKKVLLATIEEVGDAREIPLLKDIITAENTSDIKQLALSILKSLKEASHFQCSANTHTESENSYANSVFEKLYEEGDIDAKMVLLKELVKVGDYKELCFLNKLLQKENSKLKHHIQRAKDQLQSRLYANLVQEDCHEISLNLDGTGDDKNEICDTSFKDKVEGNVVEIQKEVVSTVATQQKVLPLEYAFANNEISPLPKEEAQFLDVAFEPHLSLEQKNLENYEETSSDKEHINFRNGFDDFLEQLVQFPKKIKDTLDG